WLPLHLQEDVLHIVAGHAADIAVRLKYAASTHLPYQEHLYCRINTFRVVASRVQDRISCLIPPVPAGEHLLYIESEDTDRSNSVVLLVERTPRVEEVQAFGSKVSNVVGVKLMISGVE